MVEKLAISVPQAAELLGISTRHAWTLVQSGELPVLRLGRRVLVPRERLNRMLSGAGA